MNKNSELPYELKKDIYKNGKAMNAFYQLPQDERERVLEKISETNEAVKENSSGKAGGASD